MLPATSLAMASGRAVPTRDSGSGSGPPPASARRHPDHPGPPPLPAEAVRHVRRPHAPVLPARALSRSAFCRAPSSAPATLLVFRHSTMGGCTVVSLQRASATAICQSAPGWQALTLTDRPGGEVSESAARRPGRHWGMQLKSRAARYSALPGSGVQPNSRRSSAASQTLAARFR